MVAAASARAFSAASGRGGGVDMNMPAPPKIFLTGTSEPLPSPPSPTAVHPPRPISSFHEPVQLAPPPRPIGYSAASPRTPRAGSVQLRARVRGIEM